MLQPLVGPTCYCIACSVNELMLDCLCLSNLAFQSTNSVQSVAEQLVDYPTALYKIVSAAYMLLVSPNLLTGPKQALVACCQLPPCKCPSFQATSFGIQLSIAQQFCPPLFVS